ncbi:MAG TPA: 3-hydroxyacyl-CoA dehydrogenase NAD-binding domain-containing protein, partial [Vicinamibacterales bacterium]
MVGAGQMGAGIAQVFAAAGYRVLLHDVDEAAYARGRSAIEKNLARAVDKAKTTRADADALLDRIAYYADLSKHVDVAIAIEAATEDEAVKKSIFATLDAATPSTAVL